MVIIIEIYFIAPFDKSPLVKISINMYINSATNKTPIPISTSLKDFIMFHLPILLITKITIRKSTLCKYNYFCIYTL